MANVYSVDFELSSSQYATASDSASLSITGDFSIESWIKLEQLPSTSGTTFSVVCKRDTNGTDESYMFQLDNTDDLRLIYSEDGTTTDRTQTTSDANIASAGEWTHVAVTADVSVPTVIMYKNGSSVASSDFVASALAVHDNASSMRIGSVDSSANSFFDGLIDEVRIWNDIRTSGEISDNYQKELIGDESGLAAYYKMNGSYLDETSNNNNLTATGSPVFSADVPFVGSEPRAVMF